MLRAEIRKSEVGMRKWERGEGEGKEGERVRRSEDEKKQD